MESKRRRPVGSHRSYRFHIVTVSTSKFARMLQGDKINDESGDAAEKIIRKAGGTIAARRLISDDVKMLRKQVEEFLGGKDDVAVFVGGTGVSHDDLTVESIKPFLEKELEGFGEILRYKSYRRIGGAAFLTRAIAGVVRGKLIVCLPGSPDAVVTGLREPIEDFASILDEARD